MIGFARYLMDCKSGDICNEHMVCLCSWFTCSQSSYLTGKNSLSVNFQFRTFVFGFHCWLKYHTYLCIIFKWRPASRNICVKLSPLIWCTNMNFYFQKRRLALGIFICILVVNSDQLTYQEYLISMYISRYTITARSRSMVELLNSIVRYKFCGSTKVSCTLRFSVDFSSTHQNLPLLTHTKNVLRWYCF